MNSRNVTLICTSGINVNGNTANIQHLEVSEDVNTWGKLSEILEPIFVDNGIRVSANHKSSTHMMTDYIQKSGIISPDHKFRDGKIIISLTASKVDNGGYNEAYQEVKELKLFLQNLIGSIGDYPHKTTQQLESTIADVKDNMARFINQDVTIVVEDNEVLGITEEVLAQINDRISALEFHCDFPVTADNQEIYNRIVTEIANS